MSVPLQEDMRSQRLRWLADLEAAIEEAQQLAWRIGFLEGPHPEAMELYARLDLARAEVEALRRSGWNGRPGDLPPEWTDFLPALRLLPEAPAG